MSDRVRKTFDDAYGRHALVMPDSEVDPLFGRVDVLSILEKNRGARLHPSRVASEYVPTHAKVLSREWECNYCGCIVSNCRCGMWGTISRTNEGSV